jgi:predicted GNAT family N-acyltransferase
LQLSSYSIAIVDWQSHEAVISAIRRQVFIVEQGVSEALELDSRDSLYTHALAVDNDGNGIATGRLTSDGKIGRMAVLRAWRGRGLGSAILKLLINTARKQGLDYVELNAQVHATEFYAEHGFVESGDTFMEAGIEHINMTLALTQL